MRALWFEIPVQLAVVAALGFIVFRDAAARRTRFGAAPGGVSPQTWAGLCGLLWVPTVFYVARRRRQDVGDVQPGSSIKHQWWLVAVGVAIAWLASDVQAARTSNIVEHSLYLALVLAGWAWATVMTGRDSSPAASRDRN